MEPETRIVEIGQIIPCHDVSGYDVRKMVEVLERQGQIEPLQVKPSLPETITGTATYHTFEQDPWGAEIVQAAKSLHWSTLLVVITDKFIV